MSIAVTRTKLQVPRRRNDLLSRSRLNYTLLDILDYPYTLISAPAGYGKTSLMIDLAHQASYPVCWYSIGPLDKEPKRFLAHLIHAIKVEFPSFGNTSLDLLENLPDPLDFPGPLVSTLSNDIYNTITENFAIFLDDFHLLDNQPQINKFISCFGQQMDENAHLIMSSRSLFNFPDLSLLIARKQVKGINQEDLAFQPQELRQYFQDKLHQPLSEADSEEMVRSTSGWITGLLLGKSSPDGRLADQHKAVKVTGADLDDYFSDQVFQNQPDAVRKPLMQTSLFDEFNAAICKQVLGESETISWDDFLIALTENNLFVELVEDNGLWVRYHHLFRDYLRRELEKRLPEEARQILERLVAVGLENQDWEKAFDAARQLGDPERMAEVIDVSFSSLFHAGRINLLAEWLEKLPPAGFEAYPILNLILGITYTSLGEPRKGLVILLDALCSEEVTKSKELYYRALLCISTTHRLMGNYTDALTLIEDILYKPIEAPNKTSIIAELNREAALCHSHLGQYDDAIKFFDNSLELYESIDDSKNSALVHSDLGCIVMTHGQYNKAKIHFKQAQMIWSHLGNFSQLSILYNNLGALNTLTGDYFEAKKYLLLAENYSIDTNNSRMKSFILGSYGDLANSLQKYAVAYDYYQSAEEIARNVEEGFLVSYLPISKAKCLHALEELAIADKYLTEIRGPIFRGISYYEHGLWHLEHGMVCLLLNDLDNSQEAFQSAHDIFDNYRKPYEQAKACLGLCLVSSAGNQADLLEQHLLNLETLLGRMETFHPLLPEFSRHREAIQQMAASQPGMVNISTCLYEIEHYLQRLPKLQERIIPHMSALPVLPGMEIQALGDTLVSKEGKRITSSEWIHQKTVREIFFFILCHPQGVTRDQIGLAFWTESSPSQLSCQFKNAMYRLRRALGKETIIFHQETHSYSFNWDCRYTYDVEDFQEACQLAENQPREDLRVEDLRRAATLYNHPFAPQLEGTWAEPFRRKLYLEYEKALLEVAAYDLKIKNYTSCRDLCLAILEIEPCHEKAYQLCMEAYYRIGDYINLRRTFFECETNLKRTFKDEPSTYTKSLYKKFINSM